MNKIDIDRKIRGYFYCILDNDDVIFNKRNKKTLGKYLFCKIKLNVEGAKIKLIKKNYQEWLLVKLRIIILR